MTGVWYWNPNFRTCTVVCICLPEVFAHCINCGSGPTIQQTWKHSTNPYCCLKPSADAVMKSFSITMTTKTHVSQIKQDSAWPVKSLTKPLSTFNQLHQHTAQFPDWTHFRKLDQITAATTLWYLSNTFKSNVSTVSCRVLNCSESKLALAPCNMLDEEQQDQ